MNLCIDQGNTRTKIAVFQDDGKILFAKVYNFFTKKDVEQLFVQYPEMDVIVSSVAVVEFSVIEALLRMSRFMVVFNSRTPVPVVNAYDSPETLGSDRLAAAVGANYLYPNENLLIVDAGSAITYDFVNEHNTYCGGNIAPGISMRFVSLHEYTNKLPLVTVDKDRTLPFFGKNTRDAIAAGVMQGVVFELQGYRHTLLEKYRSFRTVLTGGDAPYLAEYLSETVICEESLVLIGLNRILEYNKP